MLSYQYPLQWKCGHELMRDFASGSPHLRMGAQVVPLVLISHERCRALVTCTGQPLLLSAPPLRFCFTGLQMQMGLMDEEK